MLTQLKEALKREPRLREFQDLCKEGGSLIAEGLWDGPKACLISLAQSKNKKNILVVVGEAQEERRLFDDFALFTSCPVLDFPAWETLPNEKIPPSPDIVGERYEVLRRLLDDPQPKIILASLQACLQRVAAPDFFRDLHLELRTGQNISFSSLVERFEKMGYVRSTVAADKGEFAVRGGILDIFPVSSPAPFRIEFWGDDIESIRQYDPSSQKSVGQLKHVSINPGQELDFINREEKLCTLLDYLGPDCAVVFDGLLEIEDRYASIKGLMDKACKTFMSFEEFFQASQKLQKFFFSTEPLEELSEVNFPAGLQEGFYSKDRQAIPVDFQIFDRNISAQHWAHPFQRISNCLDPEGMVEKGSELLVHIPEAEAQSWKFSFLHSSKGEKRYLQEQLEGYGVALTGALSFANGYLSSGFALPSQKWVLFPCTELHHRYKIRRQQLRTTFHSNPTESLDLCEGELVVHTQNGVGRFLGIEKKTDHKGNDEEFFSIEYAEGSKLFVPLNQSHQVFKYIGAKDESPKLHTIGGSRWKRMRASAERAILGYAADLLNLYAERQVRSGYACGEDGELMRQFEDEFPFVETEDQLKAIGDVKKDLCIAKPMERLVCGDVGYGKTEVAMRAAFKAVVDGGVQVAMLVPTTLLAMQHFETFSARMRHFPVKVGVISRFRKPKEVKATLEAAEKGEVDILIGTHRLVSKDVKFKKLGLAIVDEEQRFGVRTKEHLKKLKKEVDYLVLSATPIPRTLYMSMVGARDLSLVNTPPHDRLPIKTLVSETDDEIIKNTLLRELARNGQAYFIHNRVETLPLFAGKLQKLLPKARIATAHGQMASQEVDSVFHAFKEGRIDILLATSILENGIDIPNANTILIDRADRFGLAELYQLRGRVGRWNRRAFAVLLVPKRGALPELTQKRLQALVEAGGFGGGIKVAMRDLQLRGAGDILGTEQSGHVSSIGFPLYCQLLKKTIRALQGSGAPALCETKMEFAQDARIPEYYVNATSLRLEMYQRLGEAESSAEVDEILKDMRDRYGPHPEPVHWLHYMTRIRVFASQKGITLLKIKGKTIAFERKDGNKSYSHHAMIRSSKSPEALEKSVIEAISKVLEKA